MTDDRHRVFALTLAEVGADHPLSDHVPEGVFERLAQAGLVQSSPLHGWCATEKGRAELRRMVAT